MADTDAAPADDVLAELRLAFWQIPLDGPPDEWYDAVAPSAAALTRIVLPHFPDVATYARSSSDQVLETLKRLGRHDAADAVAAAVETMRGSEGGRAVLAVCDAAYSMAVLGSSFWDEMATYSVYKGKPYLPGLLAASRFYHELASRESGGGAAAAPPAARHA